MEGVFLMGQKEKSLFGSTMKIHQDLDRAFLG
jgi:hypothetical protein